MYKLFVMDVDGTLTDGKIYMSANGEIMKAFHVRDGYGIANVLKEKGIQTAIITGRKSEIVEQRAKELKIDYVYQGVRDKLSCLKKLVGEIGCTTKEVVYVGDDVNDLDCISEVGLSCCPNDAHERVKEKVKLITQANGGNGAIREIIDMICNPK